MQWDSSGIASKEVVLGSPALTSWISWLWLTSAAKADSESEPFIAAVNRSHPITPKAGVLGTRRCATQNQGRHRLSCALGIPMHRSFRFAQDDNLEGVDRGREVLAASHSSQRTRLVGHPEFPCYDFFVRE